MSHDSANEVPEGETETVDDAGVRARLAKEVADWSAERSGRARSDAVELAPPEAKPAPRATKPAVKRAAKPAQPKLASAPSKPFSMSYDGVSSREYMDQVIARGSR